MATRIKSRLISKVATSFPRGYLYHSRPLLSWNHDATVQPGRRKRHLTLYVSPEEDQGVDNSSSAPPLVSLNPTTILTYPTTSDKKNNKRPLFQLKASLAIAHARQGGHVILGRNGSGKSLISNAIAQGFQVHRAQQSSSSSSSPTESTRLWLSDDSPMTFSDDQVWHGQAVAHVSFESHEELVALRDEHGHPITVQKAITQGGTLNKAAKFLIVRFGLFPMLHRHVTTLSTGEIRKVLVVRALAQRPRLLVLDNAFDGLDVPSRRSLLDLVSKTLQGFRPDILVQAVHAKATAHTQVLLLTHRAQEIVDDISTVSYFVNHPHQENDTTAVCLHTEHRLDRSGEELLQLALGGDNANDTYMGHDETLWTDNDLSVPTSKAVLDWWHQERGTLQPPQPTLVSTENLAMQSEPTIFLLKDLNWTVRPGQHWWIAGGNGAGKSTLSRLLARQPARGMQGTLQVNTMSNGATTADDKDADRRFGVGWVSTESHLTCARSPQSTQSVLINHYQSREHHSTTTLFIATKVLAWLDMPTDDAFLQRPFAQLSQGEQKLVLIAAALTARPALLVLDEPCQGLDAVNRQRVLRLVERICSSIGKDMSLIYITHHPEEVVPSVSHVLHLAKGQAFYQGSRNEYDADVVVARAESVISN
jgi:molybdate transport system ATP-binding protein